MIVISISSSSEETGIARLVQGILETLESLLPNHEFTPNELDRGTMIIGKTKEESSW